MVLLRLLLVVFLVLMPGGVIFLAAYLWRQRNQASLPPLDFDDDHRRAPMLPRSSPLVY